MTTGGLFGDLNGPDEPPVATGDDYDRWAQIVICQAAPDYMLTDSRCVAHVLGRLRLSLAGALREAYDMGKAGVRVGVWSE